MDPRNHIIISNKIHIPLNNCISIIYTFHLHQYMVECNSRIIFYYNKIISLNIFFQFDFSGHTLNRFIRDKIILQIQDIEFR